MAGYSVIYHFLLISVLFCRALQSSRGTCTSVTDLTQLVYPGIPNYPGTVPFMIDSYFGQLHNVTFKIDNISTTTHIGTHVDAPSHFTNGTWNISQIPLSRLIAPAVVIDIRRKARESQNALLTVSDLIEWESAYGKIPSLGVILVLTGWAKLWRDPEKYLGYAPNGTRYTPGVSGDAADWIVRKTKVVGVGIDAISIDSGEATIAHRIFTSCSLYIIENLKNLDVIPARGTTLYALPMNIKDASGAPARVIATHC